MSPGPASSSAPRGSPLRARLPGTLLLPLLLLLLPTLLLAPGGAQAKNAAAVVELTDADQHLLQQGEWLVKFYANWCGACQRFEPEYEKAAEILAKDLPGLKVAAVNIDENGALAARFQVTALPTVYQVSNGEIWSPVFELGSAESLVKSVREVKKTGRPWSGYIHPFGVVAAALGWFAGVTGSVTQLWRSLPWWSFWVGVAAIMGLTVWAVFSEEEDQGRPAIIEDRRHKGVVTERTAASATAILVGARSDARQRNDGEKKE